MITKEIKSLQHPIVKHLVKVQKDKRYRMENQTLILEGRKMLLEYAGPVETLLIGEGTPIPNHLAPKKLFSVPIEIIQKVSGTPSPEPYLAEVPFPPLANLEGKGRLLALDRISDPGNLGTLLRTALAFGFEGVFLLSCADPFSTKALRAAKGATFHIPLQIAAERELLTLIEKGKLTPYIADGQGEPSSFDTPLILILGSEAHGVSRSLKEKGSLVAIPIASETESLNVAVAGGILMHNIRETVCLNSTTI